MSRLTEISPALVLDLALRKHLTPAAVAEDFRGQGEAQGFVLVPPSEGEARYLSRIFPWTAEEIYRAWGPERGEVSFQGKWPFTASDVTLLRQVRGYLEEGDFPAEVAQALRSIEDRVAGRIPVQGEEDRP